VGRRRSRHSPLRAGGAQRLHLDDRRRRLDPGGRVGYLTRRYGLTIDNLLEADVVLADGRLVTASAREHADLFWALRGGGGNFGVVTSFLFRGNPVGTVYGGPIFWPFSRGREVLRFWRDFILQAPEDLNGWFGFVTVPPAPMFPQEHHLQKMCVIVWCYTGDPGKADAVFADPRARRPRWTSPARSHFRSSSLFDGPIRGLQCTEGRLSARSPTRRSTCT
jgi:hypothetical protein